MSALPTIQQSIDIGRATIYLMSNDYSKGGLFGPRLVKEISPVLIAYVTSAIQWEYESNPTNDTLRGTCDYLLWLCGRYRLQATSLSGGGSVVPIPPGATTPNRLDFIVSGVTPIITGQSQVFFNSGVTDFRGYNLQFDRGNQPQGMVNDGLNTYFSWNKITGEMNIFGAANAGEIFAIIPTL